MKNYYEILGVSTDSSKEEIKNAFKELIRKYHPDRNDAPDANEKTRDIIEAYKILTDDDARKRYDSEFSWENNKKAKEYSQENYNQEGYGNNHSEAPRDPILEKWIKSARKQAKEEMSNFKSDFPDASKSVIKGIGKAFIYIVAFNFILYILVSIFAG